jgi:hypothetical protein
MVLGDLRRGPGPEPESKTSNTPPQLAEAGSSTGLTAPPAGPVS